MGSIIVSLYMWWPIAGKAPVELWDGQSQHFVSFVYFGEYIREIIKNILIDHNFSIPTYDFSIGYGQDYFRNITLLYKIGDPFSPLAHILLNQSMQNLPFISNHVTHFLFRNLYIDLSST